MNRKRIHIGLLFTILLAHSIWGRECLAQIDTEVPHELHTILKAGQYDVSPDDLVQVRYKTRATANGIRTLDVKIEGDALTRLALVSSAIDPTKPMLPGSEYFLIILLKVTGDGQSQVSVTPVQNDDVRGNPFRFTVNVRSP